MGGNAKTTLWWKDWLAEVSLKGISASTRGIWIQALAVMACGNMKGKISALQKDIHRILDCTEEEWSVFVNENNVYKFADVTFCNEFVIIINRRMYREGKRREYIRNKVAEFRGKQESKQQVKTPSTIPLFHTKQLNKIKVVFEDGMFKNLSTEFLDKCKQAYPAIDVHQEIKRAEAWVLSHPHNKKSQWERFLNSWFRKAQDYAPPKREPYPINPPKNKTWDKCKTCGKEVLPQDIEGSVCIHCMPRVPLKDIMDKIGKSIK